MRSYWDCGADQDVFNPDSEKFDLEKVLEQAALEK
jgi:hypothetical protein